MFASYRIDYNFFSLSKILIPENLENPKSSKKKLQQNLRKEKPSEAKVLIIVITMLILFLLIILQTAIVFRILESIPADLHFILPIPTTFREVKMLSDKSGATERFRTTGGILQKRLP